MPPKRRKTTGDPPGASQPTSPAAHTFKFVLPPVPKAAPRGPPPPTPPPLPSASTSTATAAATRKLARSKTAPSSMDPTKHIGATASALQAKNLQEGTRVTDRSSTPTDSPPGLTKEDPKVGNAEKEIATEMEGEAPAPARQPHAPSRILAPDSDALPARSSRSDPPRHRRSIRFEQSSVGSRVQNKGGRLTSTRPEKFAETARILAEQQEQPRNHLVSSTSNRELPDALTSTRKVPSSAPVGRLAPPLRTRRAVSSIAKVAFDLGASTKSTRSQQHSMGPGPSSSSARQAELVASAGLTGSGQSHPHTTLTAGLATPTSAPPALIAGTEASGTPAIIAIPSVRAMKTLQRRRSGTLLRPLTSSPPYPSPPRDTITGQAEEAEEKDAEMQDGQADHGQAQSTDDQIKERMTSETLNGRNVESTPPFRLPSDIEMVPIDGDVRMRPAGPFRDVEMLPADEEEMKKDQANSEDGDEVVDMIGFIASNTAPRPTATWQDSGSSLPPISRRPSLSNPQMDDLQAPGRGSSPLSPLPNEGKQVEHTSQGSGTFVAAGYQTDCTPKALTGSQLVELEAAEDAELAAAGGGKRNDDRSVSPPSAMPSPRPNTSLSQIVDLASPTSDEEDEEEDEEEEEDVVVERRGKQPSVVSIRSSDSSDDEDEKEQGHAQQPNVSAPASAVEDYSDDEDDAVTVEDHSLRSAQPARTIAKAASSSAGTTSHVSATISGATTTAVDSNTPGRYKNGIPDPAQYATRGGMVRGKSTLKPFRSPVVGTASPSARPSPARTPARNTDSSRQVYYPSRGSDFTPQSDVKLKLEIKALEKRLQNLKEAQRIKDGGLIEKLDADIALWRNGGRQAAELLWERTGGIEPGNGMLGTVDSSTGFGEGFSSWGWQTDTTSATAHWTDEDHAVFRAAEEEGMLPDELPDLEEEMKAEGVKRYGGLGKRKEYEEDPEFEDAWKGDVDEDDDEDLEGFVKKRPWNMGTMMENMGVKSGSFGWSHEDEEWVD